MCKKYFGEYREILSVRSLKRNLGAATSYISYALESGEIDGAIVVKADEQWKPQAVVVKTSEELKEAIGTKWVIVPMIKAIIDALRVERLERIAIIGTPCQCQAIRDIKDYPMQLGDIFERIKLSIGLFCMGSFTQDGFKTMVERKLGISLPEIKDAYIEHDRFVIILRNGKTRDISIEKVKNDVKLACLYCDDFTARSADISFGNAGSISPWRTAIIRSDDALRILKDAASEGYLQYKEMEKSGIEEVKQLSIEKIERARKFSV